MTACFVGHRQIEDTKKVASLLKETILQLIENGVNTFLFGSMSQFDQLAWEVVTEFREEFPFVKRVYVRSAFQHIPDWYEDSLLKHYESTYFPEHMENAGRASYVERNQEMINHSKCCVVYYDENYLPPRSKNSGRDLFDYQPKSGIAVAYDYAVKKKKEIINVLV